jgi:hypothetical protein
MTIVLRGSSYCSLPTPYLAAFLLCNGAVPPKQKVRADRHSALFGLKLPEESAFFNNTSQKPSSQF